MHKKMQLTDIRQEEHRKGHLTRGRVNTVPLKSRALTATGPTLFTKQTKH